MTGPQIKRLYYTLAEVSRKTRLKPHVIKAWSDAYGRIHPTKGKGGRLLYRPRDVDLILLIQKFHRCGYSEDTIRELLLHPRPEESGARTASPQRTGISGTLMQQISAGLEEILSILDRR